MASEPAVAEVDLRPLATSELIDRGFALYRQHFAGLFLLALLAQAAPLLMQVLTTALHLSPTANEMVVPSPRIFGNLAIFLVILTLAQLASFALEVVMTYYIADAYLGLTPSVTASFQRFAGRLGASLWTCVLNRIFYAVTLVFPILAVVAIEVVYLVYPPPNFPLLVLFGLAALALFIGSLVPILVVFMRLILTVPAVALEKLSGWAAARRSSELVRFDPGLGFFYWGEMRLSFLLLPLFVIQVLTSTLTSIPMVLAQINDSVRHGAATPFANQSDTVVIGSQILTYIAGAIILPLYTIAVTIFYYDVRIRREGFDLEFLAARLESRS